MLTVEELLMPRRKVIADYPGCEFEIGQIITFTHKSDFFTGSMDWVSEFTKTKDGKVQFCIKKIEPYPHLFQPLPWWSDRKVEDMPEYIKFESGEVVRVINFKDNFFRVEGYRYSMDATFFKPSTLAEYEAYNQQQNKP
jgi:hypothetical protein